MSILFVTGTDTGVGKTFVACALVHALRAAGRRVAVMKPVETGVDGVPEDAVRLRDAAGDPAPLDDVCPYRFRAPLAPAAAAPLEGQSVDPEKITSLLMRRALDADMLVVEGAGGLLVPVTSDCTWLDIVRTLRLPLLVVAANRLGTLNHCALTARVARAEGIAVHGFALSHPDPVADASSASNAALISTLTRLPVIATLPHSTDPHSAAQSLAPFVELL
jgi:dethiobiotin synthetase